MKQKCCRHNLQLGQDPIDGTDGTEDASRSEDGTKLQIYRKSCCQQAKQVEDEAETDNSRNSITDETVLKAVEHYIEGPRKPVLQEKQVFLV